MCIRDSLKVVTRRHPTEQEIRWLLSAFKVVSHVKSNAIVLWKDDATIGVGAGQMNRVGSCLLYTSSVYDKSGVVEFAKALHDLGFEILSTGGTAAELTKAGIPVTSVSEVTRFPEILGGRVKTLHPAIHAGILARRTSEQQEELKNHEIEPIELVAVNLYPFEKTIAKPGVCLLYTSRCV